GDYNAQVILAVGQKVPRWPECHFPEWATELTETSRRQDFFLYLSAVIDRYKNHPALQYWQIENEPYLGFGECILAEKDLLDQEITVVKAIDPVHKIIISDSGEIGRWYRAAKRGDIFGTTMYRRVYNSVFGYVDYHLPPEFFQLKEKIIRFLIKDRDKHFIVVELAAEPWLPRQLYETSPEEQFQHFDLAFFQDTIQYATQAGFDENYLWGVEWWYWLKERHGHPEFWDFAKTLFK
ncbi:MAG: hypothetical protein Q8P35_03040, partial [Candidatus Yanofskybacteria bacterium]|nr:hypothetical protein [Candidatus Yanofskybacteria bacterium]